VIENWLSRNGGARADDLCGLISWTHDFSALTDTCMSKGIYDITFTATDECGNTNSTHALLTIADSLATGISNPRTIDFTMYPNPASDFITLTYNQTEVKQVQLALFDAFGKIIWSDKFTTQEIKIPVYDYPHGMYFLQIRTIEGICAQRVIVN
jgi:hypothetical protein